MPVIRWRYTYRIRFYTSGHLQKYISAYIITNILKWHGWEEAVGFSQREPLLGWKSGRKKTASHPGAGREACPPRTLRADEWPDGYLGGTAEVSFVLWDERVFYLQGVDDMDEMKDLGKYEPGAIEEKWYNFWEEHGVFHDEPEEGKEPYSIVLPPPNVTGQLHMGHALDNTLQDILIRYKRMQGYNVLWLPGKDHAGIATQVKVEKQIAEEGLTKYDLGREKFLERVWEWKEKYGNTIGKQIRRLGSSCDWSRERFTMDDVCARAVREVFVSLYEKGLIYQGFRITNWCPRCQTALSDIEVEHEMIWAICGISIILLLMRKVLCASRRPVLKRFPVIRPLLLIRKMKDMRIWSGRR